MKRAFLFTKTIICVLLLQVVLFSSFSGEEDDTYVPVKQNWDGVAEMGQGLSPEGSCAIPAVDPDGGYKMYVIAYIFLKTNIIEGETYPDLYLYYSLPNGESDYILIRNSDIWLLDEETREAIGNVPPVDYFVMKVFEVCWAECEEFSFCSEYSLQLLTSTNGQGLGAYPMDPLLDDSGLFPKSIFESDENGYAYHYTEYKEICCPGQVWSGNIEELDPCQGANGTVEITIPWEGYGPGPSPCLNLGSGNLVAGENGTNNEMANAGIMVLGQDKTNTETTLFPNPGNTNVIVQFDINQSGPVKFEWLDVQGRVIESTDVNDYQEGTQAKSFDVSAWQTGIYFLRISSPEGSQTLRFVKSSD